MPRGLGVGSKLLKAWTDAAGKLGVRAVHAGVSDVNLSGLRFWTARGFEPIHREKGGEARGTIWCGLRL